MTLRALRLRELGRELVQTSRDLMTGAGIPEAAELALRLPALQDPVLTVVATGAYNAGKSTLLSALTGADLLIDPDVATSSVTRYAWHDIALVDTPGVAAGHEDLHDEFAERAVREADLVIFVLTGNFFDDVTVQHFRHVLFDLGKLAQTLVVINKKAQRAVTDDICREAVVAGLGRPGTDVTPVLRCDAKQYLRAAGRDDEAERRQDSWRPRTCGGARRLRPGRGTTRPAPPAFRGRPGHRG